MEDRHAAIRAKLSVAQRRNRARMEAEGAIWQQIVWRPVLDEASVSSLEMSLGVPLPQELRDFLTNVNGGSVGPGLRFSVYTDDREPHRRADNFAFTAEQARELIEQSLAGSSASLPLVDEEVDDDWPPGNGFAIIAQNGCVTDVIVTAGPQRGKIWNCDMGWSPYYDRQGRQVGFLDWYEAWLDRFCG